MNMAWQHQGSKVLITHNNALLSEKLLEE